MRGMRKINEELRLMLERRLGHEFRKPALLSLALTHTSFANEAGRRGMHNERLEFLGDAVLELCVSEQLYERFPAAREGELTRMRAHLVSTVALAPLARELGLDQALLLGRGEESQGGRNRDAILSDALEAVLAAVFCDGGFSAARAAVGRVFAGHWPESGGGEPEKRVKDAKSHLQEVAQARFRACPVYALVGSSGPEHAKIFRVSLTLPDGRRYEAESTSCKKAEHCAAALALHDLLLKDD